MTTSPPELKPDPLPGVVAELSKRLDSIERRLERLETHQREDIAALRQDMQRGFAPVDSRIASVDSRIAAVNRRLDWLIGIQIGTFVVLVGLLVSILLKG